MQTYRFTPDEGPAVDFEAADESEAQTIAASRFRDVPGLLARRVLDVADAEELAAERERLTGYHDPASIEPEQPPTIESRYGFNIVVRGHRQHVDTFGEFAVRVVDAYSTVDADVVPRVCTGPGSDRELDGQEREQLLEAAARLVLS